MRALEKVQVLKYFNINTEMIGFKIRFQMRTSILMSRDYSCLEIISIQ